MSFLKRHFSPLVLLIEVLNKTLVIKARKEVIATTSTQALSIDLSLCE